MNLRCYSKSYECHKASPNFVASTLHMPPLHTPPAEWQGVSFTLAGSSFGPSTWRARPGILWMKFPVAEAS